MIYDGTLIYNSQLLVRTLLNKAITLRFRSFIHRYSVGMQDDLTQAAFDTYVAIPIEYRKVFDDLVEAKNSIAKLDRIVLTRPVI